MFARPFGHIKYFSQQLFLFTQIAELEAQCNEADQDKQKNSQMSVRVQELQTELHEKEQVRRWLATTGPLWNAGVSARVGITMYFCNRWHFTPGLLKLQMHFPFPTPTFQCVSSPLVLTLYHSSPSGGDYTSYNQVLWDLGLCMNRCCYFRRPS